MLLPLTEAISRLLDDAEPLGSESGWALDETDGQPNARSKTSWPATDLPALPPQRHGRLRAALRTSWCAGTGPWTLTVVGESRAGAAAGERLERWRRLPHLHRSASCPTGADCVLLQENVRA